MASVLEIWSRMGVFRRLSESSSCGANAQGGGGFQPGNTCAKGGGGGGAVGGGSGASRQEVIGKSPHAGKASSSPTEATIKPDVAAKLRSAFRDEERDNGRKSRHQYTTQEAIFAAANKALDKGPASFQAVLDMGQGLSKDIGGRVVTPEQAHELIAKGEKAPLILIAPVKGAKRASEKVNGKYKGDWGRLTDTVRATVIADLDSMPKVVDQLRHELNERGWKIEPNSVSDRFTGKPIPGGYRDVAMLLRSPDGLLAELQINTPQMWSVKEGDVHRLYKEFRVINENKNATPEEMAHAQKLAKQMESLYNRAYLDSIK